MALVTDAAAPRSIVFIVRGIADASTLAAGVRPGVAVAWLERDRPALDQIADRLADGPPVAALHVVSHGRPGVLGFAAGDVDGRMGLARNEPTLGANRCGLAALVGRPARLVHRYHHLGDGAAHL